LPVLSLFGGYPQSDARVFPRAHQNWNRIVFAMAVLRQP